MGKMEPNGALRTKLIILVLSSFLLACGPEEKKPQTQSNSSVKKEQVKINRPAFDADSAYQFVANQVAFGPRVPNTQAHLKAANYLGSKLESYGFDVIVQQTVVTAFNGDRLGIKNIIAAYQPEKNNRVLLFAHWDSRPFADQDKENKALAIDGANDGASGVGILLEIARQLQQLKLNIGVDIILFDGEDYGQPSNDMNPHQAKTWCLGSQYWGNNPHKADYQANFGILLDMVGAKDAFFTKEGISRYYAPGIVEKVWNVGRALGHGKYFVGQETNHVGEDDHLYVNKLRNIPSIDIIQYDPKTRAFPSHWHTHDDNMEVIDKNTLAAVGETVLATLIQESK